MKKRNQAAALLLVGVLLTSGAMAADMTATSQFTVAQSAGLSAQPTTQTFYLQLATLHQLELHAYVIEGRNYVQLRDLGRALDFAVSYLAPQNLVVVDGISPYQEDQGASTTQPATGVQSATPSSQTFQFNGVDAELTAYVIAGNNFVQLREVGKALDFSVEYDGTSNSVTMDRSLPYEEETRVEKPAVPVPDGVVVIPQSDAQFILKEGDRVLCDDGTVYEIKDMSRFDKSMFAEGPLPPLPTPSCDWSQFPEVELPEVEVRRFTDDRSDELFVLNLYETRRMQYTLYNLIGSNAETWENGGPKLNYAQTGPLVNVHLTLDETWTYDVFWPWRESNISSLFNSRPVSQYHVQAWDHYNKGRYLETQYQIQSF